MNEVSSIIQVLYVVGISGVLRWSFTERTRADELTLHKSATCIPEAHLDEIRASSTH